MNNLLRRNQGIAQYMGGGYVPGYANGGIPGFDPSSLLSMNPDTPTMTPGSVINSSPINIPNTFQGDPRGIADIIAGNMNPNTNNVMDPDFKFEPDLSVEYNAKNPYDTNKSAYDNYMDATRTPEDDAREDLQIAVEQEKKDIFKDKMGKMGELLDVYGASKDGVGSQSTAGSFIKGTGASKVPQTRRFEDGGIASLAPMSMQRGGGVNPFLDGFEFDFDYDDYMDMINGEYNNSANTINREDAISRGYGSPQDDRIARGVGSSKLNYADTEPGLEIEIDARDETPAAYRFYPSEVSKLYSQMKGVPFSPLVAPPKEATFVDELGLYDEEGNIAPQKRIQSQLYAKDGTYVNAYADGTGRYGAQQLEPSQFPRRQELITGPGGERGDKIPAMLSDGEFVTNSAAVRGMGIMAGANPEDEYEQRLLGARQMYDYQKQAEEMAKRYA